MKRRKGVLYSYALMVFEVISSLAFTPYLAETMGQAEYGVYNLVATITSYLLLMDMGVRNASVRFIAQYRVNDEKEKQRQFLGITVGFYTIVGIITIILGMCINVYFAMFFGKGLTTGQIEIAKNMLMITMINAAFTMFFSAFTRTIIAYEQFALVKIIDMLKIALKVGIGVLLLSQGGRGFEFVILNLGITVVAGFISTFYVLFKLKITPVFKGIEIKYLKEIFSYTTIVFVQMIATQINEMTDQVLLGALVENSATIIAIYAAGMLVVQYVKTIAGHMNSVLMPGVVRMVQGKNEISVVQQEMVKIGRISLIILGGIFAVYITQGKNFMVLWMGEEYLASFYVTIIILGPTILANVQAIGSQILWAKNKHRLQAVLKIVVAIINVLLTICLIQWNAILGAAIGTAIALWIGDIGAMNIVFRRHIGISMRAYYRGVFSKLASCLCFVVLLGVILNLIMGKDIYSFLAKCVFLTIFYVILLLLYGFNEYEKNMVKDILYMLTGRKNRK